MRYEFRCLDGCECSASKDGKVGYFLIDAPMSKAPAMGSERKCPIEGCKGRIFRVPSVPEVVVRGTAQPQLTGDSVGYASINGQDIKFQFVDHSAHRDPHYQAEFNGLLGATPLAQSARRDEKTGRVVVDVVSNVKDPLGAISRAKQDGNYTQQRHNVKTPVRRRRARK